MFDIAKETLEQLRKHYTEGSRVELIKMDDPYNKKLVPGCKGTVRGVDDTGTILVQWDCGSSLGVIYGEDSCRKLDSVKVVCYGQEKIWDSREEATQFYFEATASSEGSERNRYINIYLQLQAGNQVCIDLEDDEF